MTPRIPRTVRVLAGLVLVGIALVLCVLATRNTEPSRRTRDSVRLDPSEPASLPRPTQTVAPIAVAVKAPSATPPIAWLNVATDGLPYMPASPAAPAPTGPVHPHPVSAEHARIFRENSTIQALNDAMDAKDAQTLRRFLTRYRDEYPEDAQQLQQGYELIANCLEERPGYRAPAQRYFDEETASSLRRFVLRHCLGGP